MTGPLGAVIVSKLGSIVVIRVTSVEDSPTQVFRGVAHFTLYLGCMHSHFRSRYEE